MPQIELAWEASPITAGETPSIERGYIVKGFDDEEPALLYLLSNTAPEYLLINGETLPISGANITERLGDTIWKGRVVWSAKTNSQQQGEAGSFKLRFKTGGSTTRIKTALAQLKFPANAPDPQKGIGVTKDSIEGIDITVPNLEWQEEWSVPTTQVNKAYLLKLKAVTGKVNASPFRGFPAGEVLFDGADGGAEAGKKWSLVTFNFKQSDNAVVSLPGTGLSVIPKQGWQYLDLVSETVVDNDVLIARPKYVYINTIFETANFAELGIGTN
jgi:hypothetical protein